MCFILVITILIGLYVGSLLSVFIYRIPVCEPLSIGKGYCIKCCHSLSRYDRIPIISYILLQGKCRHCYSSISIRYLLLEVLNAFIYVIALKKFGMTFEWVMVCFFTSWGLVVAMIDFDHLIIPDKLVKVGILMGILTTFIQYIRYDNFELDAVCLIGILGMFSGTAVLFIIAIISYWVYGLEGGLGMGDVKLMLPIGLFGGWQIALLTVWLSFLIGGLIGIVSIFVLKRDRNMVIPFGPCIILGSLISTFYGKTIIFKWFI